MKTFKTLALLAPCLSARAGTLTLTWSYSAPPPDCFKLYCSTDLAAPLASWPLRTAPSTLETPPYA